LYCPEKTVLLLYSEAGEFSAATSFNGKSKKRIRSIFFILTRLIIKMRYFQYNFFDNMHSKKSIDKFIPYFFIIFFVLIFIKSIHTVILANRSFSGLVNNNAYEAGLSYNKVIDESDRIKNLGFVSEVFFKNNQLEFVLKQKGTVIKDASVIAVVENHGKYINSFTENLPFKDDKYVAKISVPQFGRWQVRILAKTKDGVEIRDKKDFIIKE
jgi:nitrogen fixation protein FixH